MVPAPLRSAGVETTCLNCPWLPSACCVNLLELADRRWHSVTCFHHHPCSLFPAAPKCHVPAGQLTYAVFQCGERARASEKVRLGMSLGLCAQLAGCLSAASQSATSFCSHVVHMHRAT